MKWFLREHKSVYVDDIVNSKSSRCSFNCFYHFRNSEVKFINLRMNVIDFIISLIFILINFLSLLLLYITINYKYISRKIFIQKFHFLITFSFIKNDIVNFCFPP